MFPGCSQDPEVFLPLLARIVLEAASIIRGQSFMESVLEGSREGLDRATEIWSKFGIVGVG
jgi:hypothetical protein